MATFTDHLNRQWSIELTVPKVQSIRRVFELDFSVIGGDPFFKLERDVELLVDLLWFLCREQAEERGVQPADFAAILARGSIADATAALLAAVKKLWRR